MIKSDYIIVKKNYHIICSAIDLKASLVEIKEIRIIGKTGNWNNYLIQLKSGTKVERKW